jgi:DNA-binding transcriptional ArsR family regulator
MVDNTEASTLRSLSTVFNRSVAEEDGVTDQLSRLFSALADPTRRDLVARLATQDATVGDLAEPYDISLQAVSKHLRVLEDAGLVSRSRDAQRRPVHLEADVLPLLTTWVERYQREAEARYRRLDAVLATMNQAENPTTTMNPLTDEGVAS